MAEESVLAVDLGAESGRVMAVHSTGTTLRYEELHRFPAATIRSPSTLYWDFPRLWEELRRGISLGLPSKPSSLGVDAWAVDFGLLDAQGRLLDNPVHYRDARTQGVMERLLERVPASWVFEQTAIQFMPINTLYQLASLAEAGSDLLASAATFLMIPDLVNYRLTGQRVCEFTNATTTQLYDSRRGGWASELIEAAGIPERIFPEVVPPGTRLGSFQGIPVIAPASHDTGSAVAAVPAKSEKFAFISSGTWSLVGLETDAPQTGPAALAANVTSEGGVYGTFRLLKNVTGLWTLQQCRRTWRELGQDYDYAELALLARDAAPLHCLVPVGHPDLLAPGDHPAIVARLCRERGEPVPETPGEVVRCVLESLALEYRCVLDALLSLTGRQVEVVHIVGGGARNDLLNQLTADACGLPVEAGPVEATVLGNAAVQLASLGAFEGLSDIRAAIRASGELRRYEPRSPGAWQEAFQRYQSLRAAGKEEPVWQTS